MRTGKGKSKPQHFLGKEYCILCGKLTETAKEQPLSERKYYIEGAGQLCRECYQAIYVLRDNKNMVQFAGRHIWRDWFP